MMGTLPTQTENPKGLHGKYVIKKIVKNPKYGKEITDTFMGHDATPEFITQEVDKDAEYFVLRLDTKAKDLNHIKACRIAINSYADAIENEIPELAKDLRERYPKL